MAEEAPSLTGVIGFPIGHSRSPAIHNYWLQQHGIPGFYVPMEVSRQDFPEVLRALPKMGFRGVNITIPHKESALQYSDQIGDHAALTGAANTLSFYGDGSIHSENTDGYGFMMNMHEGVPGWRADDGPIVLLGAGGAARGVVYSLMAAGAKEVYVVNRTKARADLLRSEFGSRVTTLELGDVGDILPSVHTLINASALGMPGMPDVALPFELIGPETTVTDLVYSPVETTFLRKALEQGCSVVDGLGMLLHQAAQAFHVWFGVKPVVDDRVRQIALGA